MDGRTKKYLIFGVAVLGVIGAGIFLSMTAFKEKYSIITAKIEKIDEYGDAYLSNGDTVMFRGVYICTNGKEYYWENLNELVGKTLKIEYRVNDEGYKMVEKFYINGIECIKSVRGRGRELVTHNQTTKP